jgi:hypothetical protein
LPPGLCRIVHKLLAKSPAGRFQSAGELLRELRTLQPAGDDDEAWAAEAAAWIDSELTAAGESSNAATLQLQTLMHTQALRAQQAGRRWRRAAVFTVLAFGIGAAAAWATRPPPLLEIQNADAKPQIARQNSARDQFMFAAMPEKPSEAAFMAVWEYFPPEESQENLYYSRRAKQRLAQLYHQEQQFDHAAAIYKELTLVEPTEYPFRIIGHFGLANVAHARGDKTKSEAQQSEGLKLLEKIPRERRWELVETLVPALRAGLPQALRDARPPP